MKKLAIAALWIACSTVVLATEQVPEPLQIGSVVYHVHGNVLSDGMLRRFRDYRAKNGAGVESTANAKGYHIELAVVEARLIIRSIKITAYTATAEEVIGTVIPRTGLHASWFS